MALWSTIETSSLMYRCCYYLYPYHAWLLVVFSHSSHLLECMVSSPCQTTPPHQTYYNYTHFYHCACIHSSSNSCRHFIWSCLPKYSVAFPAWESNCITLCFHPPYLYCCFNWDHPQSPHSSEAIQGRNYHRGKGGNCLLVFCLSAY